jgi:MFS family permease
LYVAAALTGVGAGPMWVSQGALATWYAAQLNPQEPTMHIGKVCCACCGDDQLLMLSAKVQGVFYGIFQMAQVSGSLISSVSLNGQDATPHTQRILFSIYLAVMAVALALGIALLRDRLPLVARQLSVNLPLDDDNDDDDDRDLFFQTEFVVCLMPFVAWFTCCLIFCWYVHSFTQYIS